MVLASLIEQWCRYCPNDRDFLSKLREEQVKQIMCPRIAFGTSGLRAEMGPGFARMNQITVQIAAKSIAEYAKNKGAKTVIVGYDHRHNSKSFAEVSAKQFKLDGMSVILFDHPIPTPLLAFAVTQYKCDYGIMVTASHNPKQDNGYKVYRHKGCQIVSPEDKEIAKMIASFDADLDDLEKVQKVEETAFTSIFSSYCSRLLADFKPYRESQIDNGVRIVYTPVHGVGQLFVDELVKRANLPPLISVPVQSSPDPDFSTVKFPNPEEGWLACEKAEQENAGFVFANDPDVDRFCLAERTKYNPYFIDTLFTEFIQSRHNDLENTVLLSTIVSSKMIERQAKYHNMHHECTLTGFKHLGNLAWKIENEEGKRVLFAFEEAIGFMVGTTVLEKDGLSALLLAYNMILSIDCSLEEYLERIYKKYGPCVQFNSYYFCASQEIPTVFKTIRERLQKSSTLQVVKDYSPSNMISLQGANNLCITLRNSGTEPKIKFYSEMQSDDLGKLKYTVLRELDPLFEGFNLRMKED